MLSIYLHESSHKNLNNPERHGNIFMYNFQVAKLVPWRGSASYPKELNLYVF